MKAPSDAALRTAGPKVGPDGKTRDAWLRVARVGEKPLVVNLLLRVTPGGARSWYAEFRHGGLRDVLDKDGAPVLRDGKAKRERPKRRQCLGPYAVGFKLEQARQAADELRRRVLAGEDVGAKDDAGDLIGGLIEAFYRERGGDLRPKTIETYQTATGRFVEWCRANKVGAAADLTPARLQAFRAWLAALPRHTAEHKGRRGRKVPAGGKRSPAAVNRELRTVKTVLSHLRKGGRLPALDRDAIADTLEFVRGGVTKPVPFKNVAAIAKLLEACERHDAAVFKETRDEHRGRGEVGTTARHEPIAPFVIFCLASGCRRGEALRLKWADVDLDAPDDEGKPAGEFEIHASESKTHSDRTVRLVVSPALRRMLAAMKLQAGDDVRVFERCTEDTIAKARVRLVKEFGAPAFNFSTKSARDGERSSPTLRSTCGSVLAFSPRIFGASIAHVATAKQLGHSIVVAERHYQDRVRGVDADARTLEAAMRIEDVVERLIDGLGPTRKVRVVR